MRAEVPFTLRLRLAGSMVCALVATVVYLNCIPANFAFDDNFAVVYNGDVSNNGNSLWGLLQHDFWGQNIASPQSHKSYRPLTVLSFRLIQRAWLALPQRWRDEVVARRSASLPPYMENEAARRGLDPLLFHAANVMWHALVSGLVCRLAYLMLWRRWHPTPLLTRLGEGARAAGFSAAADAPLGDDEPAAVVTAAAARGPPPSPVAPEPATAAASAIRAPPYASGDGLRKRAAAATAAAATAAAGGSNRRDAAAPAAAPPPLPRQPPTPATPSWTRPVDGDSVARLHAPAWFAGLAFALHPVHTEAVAGVVGQAELISAALSIPAVMLYVAAAERAAALRAATAASGGGPLLPLSGPGTATATAASTSAMPTPTPRRGERAAEGADGGGGGGGGGSGGGEGWTARAAVRHWAAVAAAAGLAVAAALAKEIGITVLGAMAAADVLLVPLVAVQRRRRHSAPACVGGVGGAGGAGSLQPVVRLGRAAGRLALWAVAEDPKWLRLAALAGVGVAYVRLRSWVAVDQLVRIYRKVENSIPFSASPLERALSTAHLHARYAGLLVAPLHLSADWSFNCVPLVSRLTDARNGRTVALYGYLMWVVVAARPWGLMRTWWRAAAAAAAAGGGDTVAAAPPSVRLGGAGGAGAAGGAWNRGGCDVDDSGARRARRADEAAAAAALVSEADANVTDAEAEAEAEAGATEDGQLWGARWRLLVAAGFLVGPFFPASNVLFYVGTFIGERLLYFPSIGFCLLLAEALSCVLVWAQPHDAAPPPAQRPGAGQQQRSRRGSVDDAFGAFGAASVSDYSAPPDPGSGAAPTAGGAGAGVRAVEGCSGRCGAEAGVPPPPRAGGGGGGSKRRAVRRAAPAAVYCFMAVVLLLYAVRTWQRNYDWWSEEALFESAAQVCGSSAKVQLNLGILQRRRGDQKTALEHFHAARRIEPGYCEPGYWIGVSLINAGDPQAGLPELEASLSCKYVAAEALRALHAVFATLHAASPADPAPLVRWGVTLLRPELPHTLGEGCDHLERAAAMYAQRGAVQDASNALGWCVEAVRRRANASEPVKGTAQGRAAPVGSGASASKASAEVASEVFGAGMNDAISGPSPAQLLTCLEVRAPVYRALADAWGRSTAAAGAGAGAGAAAAASSPRVRAAMYKYIRRLEALPHCRRASAAQREEDGGGGTTPHMQLVHVVQSADAGDPWMQAEWGRSLPEVGRYQEAALHLSVSGALLQQQLALLQAGQGATARSLAEPNRPVGHAEALAGMASALEAAAELGPPAAACDLWAQAAEARRVLAAGAAAAGLAAEAKAQHAALEEAVESLRRAGTVCAEQMAAVQRLAAAAGARAAAGTAQQGVQRGGKRWGGA